MPSKESPLSDVRVTYDAKKKRQLRIEAAERGISMAERARRLIELGREAEKEGPRVRPSHAPA